MRQQGELLLNLSMLFDPVNGFSVFDLILWLTDPRGDKIGFPETLK